MNNVKLLRALVVLAVVMVGVIVGELVLFCQG